MERFNESTERDPIDIEDYFDVPYFTTLKKLPPELAVRHLQHIESKRLDDTEAQSYLNSILEKRDEMYTETEISDQYFSQLLEGQKEEVLRLIETEILHKQGNLLGAGQTARVKSMEITQGTEQLSIAIKYLLTPTTKTLSASGEHDMLHEVELLKRVEEAERGTNLEYLNIPHPYFHHKNAEIQCYGMQLIEGSDLEIILYAPRINLSEELQEKISKVDTEQLFDEIDTFFAKMHTYCLHGDIKPKNFMIDESGMFYLIDFGQSVLKMDMTDKAMEQYQNLMEAEVKNSKEILKRFIRKVRENFAEIAA